MSGEWQMSFWEQRRLSPFFLFFFVFFLSVFGGSARLSIVFFFFWWLFGSSLIGIWMRTNSAKQRPWEPRGLRHSNEAIQSAIGGLTTSLSTAKDPPETVLIFKVTKKLYASTTHRLIYGWKGRRVQTPRSRRIAGQVCVVISGHRSCAYAPHGYESMCVWRGFSCDKRGQE